MNGSENAGTSPSKLASVWGLLALLACPCHLPILLLLFSGTTAGAFLSANGSAVFAGLALLFGVFVVLAVRAAKRA